MKEMHTTYDPKEFEDRVYEKWMKEGSFRAEVDAGERYDQDRG